MNRSLLIRFLIIVIITAGVAACGSPDQNDTTHRPTAANERASAQLPSAASSAERSPPPAILMIQGQKQIAGVGGYCWYGACVDAAGIATPKDPLPISSPITGQLRLPLDDPLTGGEWLAYRVSEESELPESRGYRWWHIPDTPEIGSSLTAERQQELSLRLRPGLYVLSVAVQWSKRDAMYGFLLQVK